MAKSLADETDRSLTDIEHLRRLIRRTGLSGFDDSTPEGRLVLSLVADLERAANDQIPQVVRQSAIEMAVESILFRRSLATMLLQAKAPSPGDSKTAEAKRAAFRIGVGAYKTFSATLQDAFYLLGVEGFGPKIARKEKTFEEIIADRADRLLARAPSGESDPEAAREPEADDPLPARPGERPPLDSVAADRETGTVGDEPVAVPDRPVD